MEGIDLLILDADDTLWESSRFFERAEEDFLSLVSALGQDSETVRTEIHRRDVLRLSVTGYGARPYIDTLRSILGELGCPVAGWIGRSFSDIETNLLNHPVLLHEGTLEMLRPVSSMGFPVVVYTAGERTHQEDKYVRSCVSEYVNALYVVPVKTAGSLKALLQDYSASPERTILVGDSPRSDINPALESGVNAVHIRRKNVWQAEMEQFIHPERVAVIENLTELLRIIEQPQDYFMACTADWRS
jgi:putative hydrolase of the HAD superfamily